MMEQKIALVTGVSGGLGAAMARHFRQQGYYVYGAARTAPQEGVCDEFIPCDLTDPAARKELSSRFQRLDLLVNNAGIGSYATWQELGEDGVRRLFEVDFFAPVALTMDLLDALTAAQGSVVNISSVAAEVPVACMGAYNAAKAALRMFSESLRPELSARRIRVLTVLPGRINTGFSKRALGGRKVPSTPGWGITSPEGLAKTVWRALRRGRRSVIYPWWYGAVITFVRRFPAVNEWGNRRAWDLNG